ncbi:hypothetical protein N7489_001588 [Penicillium chrysogenum]|uniref:uncharacterized protein n=1 Tax=Penicillium chrysogenum TaxID=5076 RepID=UPI0024DF2D04|nr:uncharacterized protein N7489_001588 [Penicillium chrysogenum]KAJ5251178.1 hypothetical protein N7489_001588 [Penicillium chrysogenum]
MLALSIILCILLGTSLVFAIVELGLSAFVAAAYSGTQRVTTWSAYSGYSYRQIDVDPPAILVFLVFSSVWTILVTVAALVLPWYYSRKGFVTAKLNTVLAAIFVAAYFVTMVFWLACFADLATLLGGATSVNPYYNAVLAFGVLLWLIFLALVVFTILAMCGVLVSDWAGYQSLKKENGGGVPQTGADPAHAMPMSFFNGLDALEISEVKGITLYDLARGNFDVHQEELKMHLERALCAFNRHKALYWDAKPDNFLFCADHIPEKSKVMVVDLEQVEFPRDLQPWHHTTNLGSVGNLMSKFRDGQNPNRPLSPAGACYQPGVEDKEGGSETFGLQRPMGRMKDETPKPDEASQSSTPPARPTHHPCDVMSKVGGNVTSFQRNHPQLLNES